MKNLDDPDALDPPGAHDPPVPEDVPEAAAEPVALGVAPQPVAAEPAAPQPHLAAAAPQRRRVSLGLMLGALEIPEEIPPQVEDQSDEEEKQPDELFNEALDLEIEKYLALRPHNFFPRANPGTQIPASEVVPGFWNHPRIRADLPLLTIMARRYAFIPATSAAVERVFSCCSLYTGRRGRQALASETLYMQVFLHMNKKYQAEHQGRQ